MTQLIYIAIELGRAHDNEKDIRLLRLHPSYVKAGFHIKPFQQKEYNALTGELWVLMQKLQV